MVSKLQDKPVEVFCPIDYSLGEEVQIDWGEATVVLAGLTTRVMIYCARSAYSKATFVPAYLRDDMDSFLDAHVWLFEQLGGIPKKLAHDNLRTAVTHVYLGNKKDLTARFSGLRSHHLFESRFCNVAVATKKGHDENSVKRSGRTYPVLQSHLRCLRLAEYLQSARRCSADNVGYAKYLQEMASILVGKRGSNAIARRIQVSRLPAMRELTDFDFAAVPSLNGVKVLELSKCAYIHSHTNVVLMVPPGVGKTRIAIACVLAACRTGRNAKFLPLYHSSRASSGLHQCFPNSCCVPSTTRTQ